MAEVKPDIAVYKILTPGEWAALQASGTYALSGIDAEDGYVHFSRKGQVAATLGQHFAGVDAVVLLEVETAPLIDFMRWEPSRGGELFPHLHGTFTVDEVRRHWSLAPSRRGDAPQAVEGDKTAGDWTLPEEFPNAAS